ncbi:ergothioneine biosynthesis protein EgtB [Duganella sp. FT80W]|uniref:Ergothioneine biosynthesis protein EgtB n=1 Tax=Duganella guangzhouensis TaxID=2666084 RepID=A0A6I2KVH3_9BURK|nr:ergothioneine biosynthesis protein EgtB [Duganella guangzhouensis]MRW90055.1 ergothioneine biosynthesis protein EgtB [Duganella guangzhouensis]
MTMLALASRYGKIRRRTELLCASLVPEDHVPQPVIEVSPPKWHLGHTAWFFETLVLVRFSPGYRVFNDAYSYIFNSYYESQGARIARDLRGSLSRPTVAETLAYRHHVDRAMLALLEATLSPEATELVELGLQHEEQHQELLLTDIKYILGMNPLTPVYESVVDGVVDTFSEHAGEDLSLRREWIDFAGGLCEIGHGGIGFAFDNEKPRHAVLVPATQVRSALVTNAEYQAFILDGGYRRFEFWHAEGWDWLQHHSDRLPLYWRTSRAGSTDLEHYTLAGQRALLPEAPVTHVSFFEASAFCCWAGWRLPTEFEWEAVAPKFLWGQRWEWTGSAYLPYPGFKTYLGAASEYNGKFMLNQMVLRGASFATPVGHARSTYRNFFPPHMRWQYTGIRPARDLQASQV